MIFSRQSARRPGLTAVLALAMAIGLAIPALASQVVTVRAGSHPKFTRIVFELDGPAGYSVERVGTAKAPMLRVTVEAGTTFHRLRTTGDIRDVKVTAGKHAVATIALKRDDLRVQEMILSNPHRIVLDLYRPATAYAKAPAAEKPVAKQPEPKPEPVAVKPAPVAKAPEPAPKPTAKAEPAPKPAQEPEPVRTIAKPFVPRPDDAPEPPAGKPAPQPESVAKAPAAEPGTAKPAPAIEPAPATPAKPDAAPAAIRPAPPTKIADRPMPSAETSDRPEPKLNPVKPTEPAPAQKTAAASGGWMDRLTGDPVVQGAAALGLLVVLALVFVAMRRRRTLPNDLDVTAIAEEVEDAGRVPEGGFSIDDAFSSRPTAAVGEAREEEQSKAADADDSFAGLFDDAAPSEDAAPMPAEEPVSSVTETQPVRVAEASDTSEPDSLFGDTDALVGEEASEGEAPMNQDMDLPVDPAAGPPPPVMGGAAAPSSDVMQMLQDFERRMQTLETKLDEANEAREKLERQVAAQSEELRVQRAAIARTQRALRTMSRADEDKATEPALREGDTQAKTRVNV